MTCFIDLYDWSLGKSLVNWFVCPKACVHDTLFWSHVNTTNIQAWVRRIYGIDVKRAMTHPYSIWKLKWMEERKRRTNTWRAGNTFSFSTKKRLKLVSGGDSMIK